MPRGSRGTDKIGSDIRETSARSERLDHTEDELALRDNLGSDGSSGQVLRTKFQERRPRNPLMPSGATRPSIR